MAFFVYLLRNKSGVLMINIMSHNNNSLIAERLLQIDAVKLNVENPFTWASGWKSPIYCDNRKILSFPAIRDHIKSELSNLIFEKFPDTELIAGVATAGIAWGALVADQLKLPFIYVRPTPKEHGMGNQIEGSFITKQKTIVIEDLISTGKSSVKVINALKDKELDILGIVSIFNYGFQEAVNAFDAAGVPPFSLCNYDLLVNTSIEKKIISPDVLQNLISWRENPSEWSK